MHTIRYDNAQSDWNEALPMGNGVFGGMSYFKENRYTVALNHYEVYYSIDERYGKGYQERLQKGELSFAQAENTYEGYRKAAQENTRDYTREAYRHYRKTIWPSADTVKETPLHRGASHPPTGELTYTLAEELAQADDYQLWLEIERATTCLTARREEKALELRTVTLSDCDAVLTTVKQSCPGCIRELSLAHPRRRNQEGFTRAFHQVDDHTVYGEFSFYPQKEDRQRFEPFRFVVALRLIGAAAEGEVDDTGVKLRLHSDRPEYHILTCVRTQLQSEQPVDDALRYLRQVEDALPRHVEAHQAHWEAFFQRSGVTLPDKFLEKLWYHSLYILGCCSGKDGKRREQACGLNGLWDIRQPTIWGSLWYWDVNIQASFWPVYTANHLELAQVFNDGFLSYAQFAQRRARDFYHAHGYAIDYPFEFYNCIWPWCAQFLWWYYEYTQDTVFLREKAYPMFREQIAFIRDIVQYDEEKKAYYFFPDVSPEQGPITRNSTITLATVRYLLQIAIEANRILKESAEEREDFQALLSKLPDYPAAPVTPYGEIFKDSELAPPGIELRHPSLLMPIFPMGEITPYSEAGRRRVAENTVRFASEHSERGVFPFGWISAAAARLGKGNLALRVLYEQGLDLILRANGMGAEETDRFINHCLVDAGPLYYPCMMECVGEIVTCVNEMLLQSVGGEIVVFPAVPNGEREEGAYRQEPLVELMEDKPPESWEDCAFEKLLAKGGFEVSALRQGGRVRYVRLKSLCGLGAKLRVPEGWGLPAVTTDGRLVPFRQENGVLCFETEKGRDYFIREQACDPHGGRFPLTQAYHGSFYYASHLGRQVFAGKDRNTDTIKLLDSFLHDSYVANDRCHPLVPYCFRFGVEPEKRRKPIQAPAYAPQQSVEKRFLSITPSLRYTDELGFGLCGAQSIQPVDTGQTNCLLRDFLTGREKTAFAMDLPKGIYQILVVSGGGNSTTVLSLKGGNSVRMTAKPGEYKGEVLSITHKNCGPLALLIETEQGSCWNLNLLVVRKIASLM